MAQVVVSLKNAPTTPVLGERLAWYMTIWNQARTEPQTSVQDLPLAEESRFDYVPQDWFPLPVFIVVYWLPARDWIAIYNSWNPDFPGWIGNVFIPSPGSYYFNCATRQFELPEYRGTISKKELEYDHIKSPIPVY